MDAHAGTGVVCHAVESSAAAGQRMYVVYQALCAGGRAALMSRLEFLEKLVECQCLVPTVPSKTLSCIAGAREQRVTGACSRCRRSYKADPASQHVLVVPQDGNECIVQKLPHVPHPPWVGGVIVGPNSMLT